MDIKPLHLSHSAHHGDGGIAFAISDLMAAQQATGMYTRWLFADQFSPWIRSQGFASHIFKSGANILHCHGLWRTQTRIASELISHGYPLMVAPHGMMDDWAMAHSSWKKEIVWHLWEARALNAAVCLQALCEAEASAIQKRLPGRPVAVIPNGVNQPKDLTYSRHLTPWDNEIPAEDNILLFFGRYHQKKGIEPLMAAWQSVLSLAAQSGWWLVFIGFGDQGRFESQLQALPIERCRAYGPLFDERKSAAFQHASAFILPSYSEGLPMAALEAMSYGLPSLLSDACNLPEAFAAGAALQVEPEVTSLSTSLRQLFHLTEVERQIMGTNGKILTQEHFDWRLVAQKTFEVYKWILDLGPIPKFVRMP